MNITPAVGGDNAVVEPEDDDDPDGGEMCLIRITCKYQRKVLKIIVTLASIKVFLFLNNH